MPKGHSDWDEGEVHTRSVWLQNHSVHCSDTTVHSDEKATVLKWATPQSGSFPSLPCFSDTEKTKDLIRTGGNVDVLDEAFGGPSFILRLGDM